MKTHVRRPLSQEIENLFNVVRLILSFSICNDCQGCCWKLPSKFASLRDPSVFLVNFQWLLRFKNVFRFSIAWHPIYCIPEGKLKTSFLTFHRFGTSQAINDQTFKSQCVLEAPLIGIKFCGLHPEAWLRIQGDHYANKSLSFSFRLLMIFLRKENMSLDSYPSDHMNHSKNNNATEYQAAEVSSSESNVSFLFSFGFELNRSYVSWSIVWLGRNDRAPTISCRTSCKRKVRLYVSSIFWNGFRIRRLNRSGNPVEPHQCYHSDFEFFHQQSWAFACREIDVL